MRNFDELPSAQAIVSYQRRLESKGVYALQITDLSTVRSALEEMGALTNDIEAGGPYVTRWLDPRKNVLSSETSFWIFLLDENERIVGKIGNRYDALGRDSFYQFASPCDRRHSSGRRVQPAGRAISADRPSDHRECRIYR